MKWAIVILCTATFASAQVFNIYKEPGHVLLHNGDVISVGPQAATNILSVECVNLPSAATNIIVRLKP